MSYSFSVVPDFLKRDAFQLNETGDNLGYLADRIREVEEDLKFDFSNYAGVISALQTCRTNTLTVQKQVYQCGSVCYKASVNYSITEQVIHSFFENTLFAFVVDFWGKFTDWILNFKPTFSYTSGQDDDEDTSTTTGGIGETIDLFLHRLLPYDDSVDEDHLSLSRWGGENENGGIFHILHLTRDKERTTVDLEEGNIKVGAIDDISFSIGDFSHPIPSILGTDGTRGVKIGNYSGTGGIMINMFEDGKFVPSISLVGTGTISGYEAVNRIHGADGEYIEETQSIGKAQLDYGYKRGVMQTDDGDWVWGIERHCGLDATIADEEFSFNRNICGLEISGSVSCSEGAGFSYGDSITTGGIGQSFNGIPGLGVGLSYKIDWTDVEMPEFEWPW